MNELLDRLRKGEKTAVKQLYEQYYHHCKWAILNSDGSDDDAKDVFQQAVVSLWNKVESPDFQIKSTLKGYLYNSCRYIWWNSLKKNKKMISTTNEEMPVLIDEDESAEKQAKETRLRLLYACIDAANEGCQRLLEITYFERLPDKEIANIINIGANSVRGKRKRCMDKLKACVKQKQQNNG